MTSPGAVRRFGRRSALVLALVAVLFAGALEPASADAGTAAPAVSVTESARSAPPRPAAPPQPASSGLAADGTADGDDPSWGWGPSRVVWAAIGWLVLVLTAALLIRRRVSRRR
ncbi:hypothetical protein [Jiangella endophytica]|uniref:hypothetical protein n=1 Tax=Jiangella endophytica TaxID=1623398 RepID=UPI000E34DC8F|nr:hypothetical protein [Jiangella endophytica]